MGVPEIKKKAWKQKEKAIPPRPKKGDGEVKFVFHAGAASEVYLSGDFVHWDTQMIRPPTLLVRKTLSNGCKFERQCGSSLIRKEPGNPWLADRFRHRDYPGLIDLILYPYPGLGMVFFISPSPV